MRRALLAASALLLLPACGVAGSAAAGACSDLEVTIEGTRDADVLTGTAGRDVIAGLGGDDVLEGLGGDDVLCGGDGADRLLGGAGDDELYGERDLRELADNDYYEWYGDELQGGPGDDLLDVGRDERIEPGAVNFVEADAVSYEHAAAAVEIDLASGSATGEGEDTFAGAPGRAVGSAHDDLILGSDGPDDLHGMGGSDRLDGRAGDDEINVEQGFVRDETDVIGVETDPNQAYGGPGADQLAGAAGPDLLDGGDGDDLLSGVSGADRMLGGDGDDSVNDSLVPDGSGRQLLDGGPGARDTISFYLDPGNDPDVALRPDDGRLDLATGALTATVGPLRWDVAIRGFENASTSFGSWTVLGNDADNELIAFDEKRAVVMYGRGGDDQLAGSFRDDVLDGGPGRDTALPYVGEDRLVSIEKHIR